MQLFKGIREGYKKAMKTRGEGIKYIQKKQVAIIFL